MKTLTEIVSNPLMPIVNTTNLTLDNLNRPVIYSTGEDECGCQCKAEYYYDEGKWKMMKYECLFNRKVKPCLD